jgi:hypothetical protein
MALTLDVADVQGAVVEAGHVHVEGRAVHPVKEHHGPGKNGRETDIQTERNGDRDLQTHRDIVRHGQMQRRR